MIDDLTVQGVNINRHEKSAPGMTKGGDGSTGPGMGGLQRGPVELPAQGKAGTNQIGTHALREQPMRDCAAGPPGVIEA